MVKRSLTVPLHSSNPVPQIAYLIHAALQEHCALSPEFHADYQLQLSTLTGLGFTAILAQGSRIRSCRPHFATFLHYRAFTLHTDRLMKLLVLKNILRPCLRTSKKSQHKVRGLWKVLQNYGWQQTN